MEEVEAGPRIGFLGGLVLAQIYISGNVALGQAKFVRYYARAEYDINQYLSHGMNGSRLSF